MVLSWPAVLSIRTFKKEANYELHEKFEEEVMHVRRTKDESSLRKVEILCFSCNGCHRSALG